MKKYYCRSVIIFYPGRDADLQDAATKAANEVPERVSKIIDTRVITAADPDGAFDNVVGLVNAEYGQAITVDKTNSDWWVGTGGLHEIAHDLKKSGSDWQITVTKKGGSGTVTMVAKLRVQVTEIK